jgi:hypothetical protein
VFASLRKRATENDDRRINQTHASGENFPDVSSGLPNCLDGSEVSEPNPFYNVLNPVDVQSLALKSRGDGRAPRDSLETPFVSTSTHDVVSARYPHMANVACSALRAPLEFPSAEDSRTNAGRDFDEHEVIDAGPNSLTFSQSHDIDIVVYEDGDLERATNISRNVEPMPARHYWRVGRLSCLVRYWPWKANAYGGQVGHGVPGFPDEPTD